ncbi:MAG: restriction endonuclease subunit S [Candidatus Thiodiazotropha sp. (ex Lucinoma borealis)]|nr:restriction endonuclease subunit S [Candidatus Thiodiazotropha sp. (ex Lucinoma borealis)]
MHWPIKSLGETCNLMTGGTPSKAKPEYFENGTIRWLVSRDIHQKEIFDCTGRISELGFENSNAKYLPENSVMIALNGQGKTRGSVSLLRTKATCNQSLVSIYPKNMDELLPEFLHINLHGRYEEIRKMTGDDGNDRRGLNMPLIRSIEIPMPPIPEQQRIVAILDQVFTDIDKARTNAEQNLKNARELFDSYLNVVFDKNKEKWPITALGEIAEVKGGKRLPKGYKPTIEKTKYPYVRVADIDNKGSVNLAGMRYISEDVRNSIKRYTISSKDVFITIVGATIGKSGIVPKELDGANLTENACKLVFESNISNKFIYYFTLTNEFYEQVGLKTRTAAQPKLALVRLKTINLAVPPMDVQEALAEKFDRLWEETKRLDTIYQRKKASLDELKKSILQKAFSGELTKSKGIAA